MLQLYITPPSPKGEVKNANLLIQLPTNNEYKDIYPDFSLSSCGKTIMTMLVIRLYEDYSKQKDILINQDNSSKLVCNRELINKSI